MKIYDESVDAKYHCRDVRDQVKILKLVDDIRFMDNLRTFCS